MYFIVFFYVFNLSILLSVKEVKVWAHVRKEELIPVHELRNKLKQVLDNLEKKEIHK